MPRERIERLGRDQLASPEYRDLAQAVFRDPWDLRLRYTRWLYGENPAVPAGDPLPLYICWRDGVALGQLGLMPIDFRIDGKPLPAAWAMDFHIRPEFRRQGIGGHLLRAAFAEFPLLLAMDPTSASAGLFGKEGWNNEAVLMIHKELLRPLASLPRMLLMRLGLAQGASRLRPGEGAGRPASVERVTSLPDRRAQLEEDAGTGVGPGAARQRKSAEYLEWRYFKSPSCQYHVERCNLASRGEALAIWRFTADPRWRRARLVDLVYPHHASAADLAGVVDQLRAVVRAEGAEIFECATADRALLAALAGFLKKQTPAARILFGTADPVKRPAISPDRWQVYSGDSDIDAMACLRGKP